MPEHEHYENERRQHRTLTDADVDAIADRLEERMRQRFYIGVGKGVVRWLWDKIVIGSVLGLAIYFYTHGGHKP